MTRSPAGGGASMDAGPSAGSSTAQQAGQAEQADVSGADAASTRKRQTDGACLSAAPAEKRVKGACPQVEVPQPDRTYHLHWIVLCAQSKYFEATLSRTWQQQQQQQVASTSTDTDSTPGSHASLPSRQHQLTATIHLDEDDLPAMDLLLRLMYSHPIPEDTPSQLVWQCLKLADAFEAVFCIDLALGHLQAVGSGTDPVTLSHAGRVPDGVAARAAFSPLLEACKATMQRTFMQAATSSEPALAEACQRFLVDVYGDVSAVLRGQKLRQEFCTLPYNAVLALAQSDELRVHSENCVVFMLSWWVSKAKKPSTAGGQAITSQQVKQLANQVRVLHLGPVYQHYVLPKLWWLKSCSGMEHLPLLLALTGRDDTGIAVFPAPGMQLLEGVWNGPQQWLAKPRKVHVSNDADLTLKWTLGSSQLQQLSCDMHATSGPLYINGFILQMQAELSVADGAAALDLFCAPGLMQPNGSFSRCGELQLPVVCGPITLKALPTPGGVGKEHEVGRTLAAGRIGCKGFLKGPSVSKLLEPYVAAGKLQLEATFTDIDRL